jgi:hypothetical protein
MPFGFHLTMDTLPSGGLQEGGCRSALAVSSFRLRARLGFSIPPPSSGQRGITPAFGYDTPHLGARGTLTLLIWALPSTHYGRLRPCAPHRYSPSREDHSLEFLPLHRGDRFLRSSSKPESRSRHLHAGRQLGSVQARPQPVPGSKVHPRFRRHLDTFRHVISGSLAFVSSILT